MSGFEQSGWMMSSRDKPLLEVRLIGPEVTHGRISIADLALLGQKLQTALNRVAWQLFVRAQGRRRARLPDSLRAQCALQLVGMSSGSVLLQLDLPCDDAESCVQSLGFEALEKLITGIAVLEQRDGPLPEGFDSRVLSNWKDISKIFEHGVERVEFCLRTGEKTYRYDLLPETLNRVFDRVRTPERVRTIEGRLLMADFEGLKRRCRVHPATGSPVACTFGEAISDKVKGALRNWVRVTGRAKVDPATGALKAFAIHEIDVLGATPEAPLPQPEDFWQRKTLQQLASEQGVSPVSKLDGVLGKGAGLWETDAEFESFVEGIYSRRKEDRELGRR